AGRGRRPRPDLQGLRRRMALRRLLDVPGDEPRPAGRGRTLRLDLEPQLRGPPGQGRAYPPRVPARGRGHRGARDAVLTGRCRRPAAGRRTRRMGRRPPLTDPDAGLGQRLKKEHEPWKLSAITPASAFLCSDRTSTPTRSSPRSSSTGFADALLCRWRSHDDFVLNDPDYAAGSVLVAGPDFGTGSSREHAVWALKDYGFRVVLSSRFGDIFRGNSGKEGLLAAQLEQDDIELIWKILENHPGTSITVDLNEKTVTCDSVTVSFQIDDYTRWRLLEGHDDISLTLAKEDDIVAYESSRFAFKPKTLPAKV